MKAFRQERMLFLVGQVPLAGGAAPADTRSARYARTAIVRRTGPRRGEVVVRGPPAGTLVPLKLFLAARGPSLEPPLLFDQRLVLVDQQAAKSLQLLLLLDQFGLSLAVLVGQLRG